MRKYWLALGLLAIAIGFLTVALVFRSYSTKYINAAPQINRSFSILDLFMRESPTMATANTPKTPEQPKLPDVKVQVEKPIIQTLPGLLGSIAGVLAALTGLLKTVLPYVCKPKSKEATDVH